MIEQIYDDLSRNMRDFGRAPKFILVGARQFLQLREEMRTARMLLPGTGGEPCMLAWNGGYLSIVSVSSLDRLEYGWAPVDASGGCTPQLIREVTRGDSGSFCWDTTRRPISRTP